MSTNNLKSSLYSSLLLSKDHSSDSITTDNNSSNVKKKETNKNDLSKSSILKKQTNINNTEVINIEKIDSKCLTSISGKVPKPKNLSGYNSKDSKFIKCMNDNLKKSTPISKPNNTSNVQTEINLSKHVDTNVKKTLPIDCTEDGKKIDVSDKNIEKKLLDSRTNDNPSMNKEYKNLEKEIEFEIYLRSNLIKIIKDENNEAMIYVPCKLNMDLESLFYYFSNNSMNLKCKQFANMLHISKLYHKSKPIDILGRMFPSSKENTPYEERQIEYISFLKLLHRFSLFKFRTFGATEEEKLNLVVSFLLSCDYVEIISNKLVKSERCIQVGDPTIQRKDKDIQLDIQLKDNSTQSNQSTNSVAVNATYDVSDASCYCDIDQELNLTNIQKEIEQSNEEHQIQTFDYSNDYNIQDQPPIQDVVKPKLNEIDEKCSKKSEKKSVQKKIIQKNPSNPDSEIIVALTSICQEDDKKLFRIFAYYSGPNNDRLSYRQFYNLINDSGLLGGNFEEFLTPIQLERCYSAVIINPKGLDYWEFKEVLLYCGEASSCGTDPTSALQSIVRKYIIPLILVIYQPNNFEKCEDAIFDSSISGGLDDTKSLQTMINKAILPWFRLGSRPLLSDEYSDTCSCSSLSSENDSFEDKLSSISSSVSSGAVMEENSS